MELSRDEVAWTRIERSGLVEPFSSAVGVAQALIGVQSQFVPPAGLAIRNRLATEFTAEDLDALLHDRRALVRFWGHRNTVHIYDVADWSTVISASAAIPSYRESLTSLLGREESELEGALDRVAEILSGVERASRADLVAADASLAPWFEYGNALVMGLVRRGVVCHAALVGGKSYFAHRDVWLPKMRWDAPATVDAGVTLSVPAHGAGNVEDIDDRVALGVDLLAVDHRRRRVARILTRLVLGGLDRGLQDRWVDGQVEVLGGRGARAGAASAARGARAHARTSAAGALSEGRGCHSSGGEHRNGANED